MRGQLIALLLPLLLATKTTIADIPRPRGVSLAKASLYQPRADKTWVCLDGSKSISYLQLNDDYCDCADGSDEPGTAACAQGRFHCANVGHRSEDILSSRVNDGICDCCDGTDEYRAGAGNCYNTCKELGRVAEEQRRNEAELHKRGSVRRDELIERGKQKQAERKARLAELEQHRAEQEALKAEKEDLKRVAEAAEAEALELYKEQQREHEAATAGDLVEEVSQTTREEAEDSFLHYDTNKDGFVEITELQVDISLDRDRNGVVTIEEAKWFLDERERIDLDAFVALSWPRIKTIKMLAEGLFKPPVVSGSENDEEADHHEGHDDEDAEELHDADHENAEDVEGEEEEGEDYEQDDVGVGTVASESTPAPEYDPETQRLIEQANEARNAFAEVEREIRQLEQEIRDIETQSAKDYGHHGEYAAMDGECYTFEDREYVYTLCPFDRASQKPRAGGAETTLGRWDQWIDENGNKFAKQKYSHGASCWNGPQRSATVQIKCALEHKITAVSEPNRCEYYFTLETPAACDGSVNATDAAGSHDEL